MLILSRKLIHSQILFNFLEFLDKYVIVSIQFTRQKRWVENGRLERGVLLMNILIFYKGLLVKLVII